MTLLLAHGHRLEDIRRYTLKQVKGFAEAASRRDSLIQAGMLRTVAVGAQGDTKAINDEMEQLTAPMTKKGNVKQRRVKDSSKHSGARKRDASR